MSARPRADEDAWFEQLFHSTRADILAYLTRRTGSGEAAEAADLLADVYLVAWRRRDDLPEGKERLWLFGAARRLLAQHHRHQAETQRLHQDLARRRHQPTDDPHRCSSQRPADDSFSVVAAIVHDALNELSDLDQELIMLTAWEQLSTADAARVVGNHRHLGTGPAAPCSPTSHRTPQLAATTGQEPSGHR
ncbi:MAG: RNA polymerase sigma factor [Janthinobacterium lividum]